MRTKVYKTARQMAYWVWNLLGVNAYFRGESRQSIRVFTIHGVGNYEGEYDWLPLRRQLDANKFRRALEILTRHYQFISIDDATAILAGDKPSQDNVAVLTFDDGYLNNFTQALPVLREFGVPAVFYIATGLVESREPFWFDRLDYVLQAAAAQGVTAKVAGRAFRFDSTYGSDIEAEYATLRTYCKKYYADDEDFTEALHQLAIDLEQQTGMALGSVLEGDPWACVVTKQDIQEFSKDELVTFGGHSVSHLRLGLSTPDKIRDELIESKQDIESWTGKPCVHFAYPNGEFNEASENAVRETGYHSAVTSEFGSNDVGANIYTLQRQNIVVDFAESELLARASGLEETFIGMTAGLKRRLKRQAVAPMPESGSPAE